MYLTQRQKLRPDLNWHADELLYAARLVRKACKSGVTTESSCTDMYECNIVHLDQLSVDTDTYTLLTVKTVTISYSNTSTVVCVVSVCNHCAARSSYYFAKALIMALGHHSCHAASCSSDWWQTAYICLPSLGNTLKMGYIQSCKHCYAYVPQITLHTLTTGAWQAGC